jgi:endonuclease G, mitochondrial
MVIVTKKAKKLHQLRGWICACFILLLLCLSSSLAFSEPSQSRDSGTIHLILGIPSPAKSDPSNRNDYLMLKKQFALSYNNSKGTANWVSWQLNASWIGGHNVDRCTTGFSPDVSLPSSFIKVQSADYVNSGFSRGGLVRSRDRSANQTDNCATFLMTNIVPQSPENNEGAWLELENLLTDLAKSGKELYIVAGPYGKGGIGFAEKISKDKVTVPASLWKIAVLLDQPGLGLKGVSKKTRVIAANIPNTVGIAKKSYKDYLTTVDELEQLTGYDFLSNVSKEIQDVIESRKDKS